MYVREFLIVFYNKFFKIERTHINSGNSNMINMSRIKRTEYLPHQELDLIKYKFSIFILKN